VANSDTDKSLPSDADLRWQLRQLPRELDPAHDLWPGIAAGIDSRGQHGSRRWLVALAMAASLVLAVGIAIRVAPFHREAAPQDLTAQVVRAEAHSMTRQYQAALRELNGAPMPSALKPSLQTLDQSAAQIRQAIAADPDSVFLLHQLQKTYARRLALTQRAIAG
jgi:hypothetical protein